jgi:hypothetical protein
MTQLLRCDQCGHLATQDQASWLVLTDLDPDGEDFHYWHFCSWACAGTYTTARALVEQ